jgi:hypothetical protein
MTPGLTVQDLMSSSILGSTRSTWGVLQTLWILAMENPSIVLVDLVDFAEESHLQMRDFPMPGAFAIARG